MTTRPVADFVATLAEPTRLRILNCIATAPLFASDLAAILAQPESDVRSTMELLAQQQVIRSVPVPYVLYMLAPLSTQRERLLRGALEAARRDPAAQADRAAALRRSRSRLDTRVRRATVDAA